MNDAPALLTINAGSSSIRYAIYRAGAKPYRLLARMVEGIGSTRMTLLDALESHPA